MALNPLLMAMLGTSPSERWSVGTPEEDPEQTAYYEALRREQELRGIGATVGVPEVHPARRAYEERLRRAGPAILPEPLVDPGRPSLTAFDPDVDGVNAYGGGGASNDGGLRERFIGDRTPAVAAGLHGNRNGAVNRYAERSINQQNADEGMGNARTAMLAALAGRNARNLYGRAGITAPLDDDLQAAVNQQQVMRNPMVDAASPLVRRVVPGARREEPDEITLEQRIKHLSGEEKAEGRMDAGNFGRFQPGSVSPFKGEPSRAYGNGRGNPPRVRIRSEADVGGGHGFVEIDNGRGGWDRADADTSSRILQQNLDNVRADRKASYEAASAAEAERIGNIQNIGQGRLSLKDALQGVGIMDTATKRRYAKAAQYNEQQQSRQRAVDNAVRMMPAYQAGQAQVAAAQVANQPQQLTPEQVSQIRWRNQQIQKQFEDANAALAKEKNAERRKVLQQQINALLGVGAGA